MIDAGESTLDRMQSEVVEHTVSMALTVLESYGVARSAGASDVPSQSASGNRAEREGRNT